MKKLFPLLLILLLPFLAKAQNTVTLESGTAAFPPQFRYKAITPDSLNHLWMSNTVTGKYNRIYTATEVNNLFYPKSVSDVRYIQNILYPATAQTGNINLTGMGTFNAAFGGNTYRTDNTGAGFNIFLNGTQVYTHTIGTSGQAQSYAASYDFMPRTGTYYMSLNNSAVNLNRTLVVTTATAISNFGTGGAEFDVAMRRNSDGAISHMPKSFFDGAYAPISGSANYINQGTTAVNQSFNLGTGTGTASNLRATAVTTGASGDSILVKKADNLIYKRPYAEFLTPAQAAAIYAVLNGGNTFTGDQIVNKTSGVNYYSVQAGTLGNFTGGNAAGYTGRAVSDAGGYYNPFIIQQYQAGTSAVFEINAGSNSGNYPMLFKAGSFNLGTIGNNIWNDNDLNRQKGLLNVFSTDGISAGQTDIFAGDLFAMPVGTQIRYCATSTTNAPTTAAGWVEQYYRDTNIRGLRYRDILGNVWINTTTAYPTWGAWVQVSTSSGSGIYALQSTAINTGYGINGGGDLSTTRNILADTTSAGGLVSKPNLTNRLSGYVTTNTVQNNLQNDKTTTGIWTYKADALGTSTTPIINLSNTTAATSGNQQVTPGIYFNSNGWGTTAGSSQLSQIRMFGLPTQGTTPIGALSIESQINGGGWTERLRITSNGSLMISGGSGSLTAAAATLSTATAIAVTPTDGLTVRNTANSTIGIPVQMSSRVRWAGSAYNTTAAASQAIESTADLLPSSGNPISGLWRLGFQVNGGGYTYPFTVSNAGVINSTSLTASQAVLTDASKNLVSVATTGTGSVVRQNTPDFTGGAFNIFSGANNTIFSANGSGNFSINLPPASGTLALTSQLTQVVEITGTTQTASIGTIYIPHNVSLTTITLPSTTAIGSLVQVIGEGAGGWKIAQLAGQQIVGVGVSTTVGTGGSIASTNANCTLTLRLTNTNKWTITSSQGTLTPL
jgi:hypothetical protein